MDRVEIITGVERGRRWRLEEKLRIVAESEQPGASVSEVARRYEVSRIHPARTAFRRWLGGLTLRALVGAALRSGAVDQVEIITGVERRRRWRLEEKLRIVAESERPGASVSEVARRYEVSRGLLWAWRRQARTGALTAEPPPDVHADAGDWGRAADRDGACGVVGTITGQRGSGRGGPDRDTAIGRHVRSRGQRREPCGAAACHVGATRMIVPPSGVRVRLAAGVTDMRRGMNGLSLQVQQALQRDPHAGDLYVFRGRRGDLLKILWHDGLGMSLYAKRLERGRFLWPSPADGVVAITAAQYGDRGRDADYSAPPAQNRASPTQALGSHLGCLTAKRSLGQGWRIRGRGSQSFTSFPIRSQVMASFWLRRRSERCQRTVT